MKFAGHQNRGMEAQGRVLAPGEGYRENDAIKSTMGNKQEQRCVMRDDKLVYGTVDEPVARARERMLILMAERTAEIEAGLVHESYAAEIVRLKG
jgi:hypothetical protein